MDQTLEIPVIANLQDIKGLKELSSQVSSAYISGVNKAITGLHRDLARLQSAEIPDGAQIRKVTNEIARKERLAKHVGRQAQFVETYIEEIDAIRRAGLNATNAARYTESSLGLRAAFRAFTGHDITGEMSSAQRKAVAYGQEMTNALVNTGRATTRAGTAFERARDAWLAFEGNERFGGDLEAYVTNEDIPLAKRQRAARQGLSLINTAYKYGASAGMLSDEEIAAKKRDTALLTEIAESGKQTAKGIGVIGRVMSPWAAGQMGARVAADYSNAVASWYSNRVNPYTQERHYWAEKGQQLGGVLGTLLGGVVGALAGPVGAAIGAGAGGAVGTWLGGSEKRQLEASESSQLDTIDRLRYRALYGGKGMGATWGKLAAKTGYVTEADMAGLMSASNTFQAAAAFGGLSESQWLGLSMMPNYFQALASGADEATLLAAYQKDMDMLGPGLGQYFTAMVPGLNENIRALAARKEQTGRLFSEGAFATNFEKFAAESGMDAGYESAYFNLGAADVKERVRTNIKGTDTKDPKKFDWEAAGYDSKAYDTLKASAREVGVAKTVRQEAADAVKTALPIIDKITGAEYFRKLLPESLTKYDLNIVVDGNKENLGPVYIDDADLRQWSTYNYMVGGQ